MRCLHCGKKISLLRKLTDEEFCSNAHRAAFRQQQEELAFSRLTESRTRLAPLPEPSAKEAPKRISAAVAAKITPGEAGPLPERLRMVDRRRLHIPGLGMLVELPAPSCPTSGMRLIAGGFPPAGMLGAMDPQRPPVHADAPGVAAQPLMAAAEPAAPDSRLEATAPEVEAVAPAPLAGQAPLPGFLAMGGGRLPALRAAGETAFIVAAAAVSLPTAQLAPAAFKTAAKGRKRRIPVPPAAGCLALLHQARALDGADSKRLPATPAISALSPPASASLVRLDAVLRAEEAVQGLNLAGPVDDRGAVPRRTETRAEDLSGYLAGGLSAPMPPVLPFAGVAGGGVETWLADPAAIDLIPANRMAGALPLALRPATSAAMVQATRLNLTPIWQKWPPEAALAGLQASLPANRRPVVAAPALERLMAFAGASAIPALGLALQPPAWPVDLGPVAVAPVAVEQEQVEESEPAPAPALERLLPVFGVRPIAAPAPAAICTVMSRPLFWDGPLEALPILRPSGLLLDQADGSGPRQAPRVEKRRKWFRMPSLPSLPHMPRWSRVWSHAPADLKWVSFAIPAVLILVIYSLMPSPPMRPVEVAETTQSQDQTASPSAATVLGSRVSTLQKVIMDRAAIRLVDDFRSGLGAWNGAAGWARSWQYNAANFVSPGALALYAPTVGMHDYSISFLAQIDRRSLNWVFRAADLKNYHVMRIVIVKPGPLPEAVIMRYAVIDGKPERPTTLPLPISIRQDTLFKVRMEVQGDTFTTYLQDQIIDSFTDSRLPAGGIGFFSPQGDRALLRWVSVMHQYDYLGRLCALLAPYTVQAEGRRVE